MSLLSVLKSLLGVFGLWQQNSRDASLKKDGALQTENELLKKREELRKDADKNLEDGRDDSDDDLLNRL